MNLHYGDIFHTVEAGSNIPVTPFQGVAERSPQSQDGARIENRVKRATDATNESGL